MRHTFFSIYIYIFFLAVLSCPEINVVVEWFVLLLRLREVRFQVQISTQMPTVLTEVYFINACRQTLRYYLKSGRDSSFPIHRSLVLLINLQFEATQLMVADE